MSVKNIAVLGSTGSVGEQALDVAAKQGFRVSAISANKNFLRVEEQARQFKVSAVAMADEAAAKELKTRLADTSVRVFGGESGICEMIEAEKRDCTVNSIIGEAGLLPTLAVIDSGSRLALANKESLVVAGEIVMARAREKGVEIIPVDSEHCAIHQCLRSGRPGEVKKLIVTASGGPFFGYSADMLSNVTAANALDHPTWSMGAKITIDSATLMNKGFELIEASHLFNIDIDKIEAIVHRESIIHSIDNSVIAQMSVPDMRYCIRYGICGGARGESVINELDLAKIAMLSFFKPDTKVFPLLDCAVRCKSLGGAMPAVLNAANEVVVEAFLKGKIGFLEISEKVMDTVESLSGCAHYTSLSKILEADKSAREYAKKLIV